MHLCDNPANFMCARHYGQLFSPMFDRTPTPPTRIVLDTNIVMDLLHFADIRTNWLKEAISSGRVHCFSDTSCLAELERVTTYPEFNLDTEGRNTLMRAYLDFVNLCENEGDEIIPLPRCRDTDDQKFLELAARCHADMLISRDKQLLRLACHRHKPPPFAIVTAVTAEKAATLLELAAEHPAITS